MISGARRLAEAAVPRVRPFPATGVLARGRQRAGHAPRCPVATPHGRRGPAG